MLASSRKRRMAEPPCTLIQRSSECGKVHEQEVLESVFKRAPAPYAERSRQRTAA